MNDRAELTNPKPDPVQARRILAIDDDAELCAFIQLLLAGNGYNVQTALSGHEGLHIVHDFHPELIVLDVRMPGMNGIEFCHRLRRLSKIPVIFLSACDDEKTILRCFEYGAADYIVKPVNSRIFLARVKAALGIDLLAAKISAPQFYSDGYLDIDPAARRVSIDGRPVQLTATEFAVLIYLMEHASANCAIEDILTHVWGAEHGDAYGHAYAYIRRLRKKLERDPQAPEYILSVYGVGYRFQHRPSMALMQ